METLGACLGSRIALSVIPILPNLSPLILLIPGLCLSFLAALFSLRKPGTRRALGILLWRQKLALLFCLAVALTSVAFVRYAPPEQSPSTTQPKVVARNWPMHRGGPLRQGATGVQQGPIQGGRQWAFRPGDQFYASAAADSRFLYTVGCRNDRGRIFCLESQSGSVVWSCAPTHYAATFSSPVITDDFLVVGEGLHHTRTARVVCVDLRPGREGTIAWTLRTNSHVECTPVIHNERVYVAAGDDGIYCLRLTPKLGGKPRVIWHRAGGDYPDAETSLILHEGLLYLGLGVGGQSLCVLDAHSGREKTRLQMPFPVFSPPSIHREKLYFGMGQGDYVTPHRDLAGQVCCLDLATLTIDWTLKTPGTVLGAVTVVLAANDENSSEMFWLACGCSDGTLLLLNPQGQIVEQIDTHSPILGSPASTGNHLYIVNNSGNVMGLNVPTLEPFWQFDLTPSQRQVSSPILHNGHLFVGTETEGFVSLGVPPPTSGILWPGRLGGAGAAGNPHRQPLPKSTRVQWKHGGKNLITAPIAAAADQIIVPFARGERSGIEMLAIGSDTTRPRVRWFAPSTDGVTQSPVISGDCVLFVDGQPGAARRQLRCFDRETGDRLWTRPLHATGALTVDPDAVYVPQRERVLACIDLQGKPRWTQTLGEMKHGVATTAELILATVTKPPALVLLDRPTGAILWEIELKAPPVATASVHRNQILAATQQGLELRSLVDGRLLNFLEDPEGLTTDLYADGRRFVYVNRRGELVSGDMRSMDVQYRLPGATAGFAPLATDQRVVFFGHDRFLRLERPFSGEPTLWCALSDIGPLSSPPVCHRGCVYVGVQGEGLVALSEEP